MATTTNRMKKDFTRDLETKNWKLSSQACEDAKDCLHSLHNSVVKLHLKKLFPYKYTTHKLFYDDRGYVRIVANKRRIKELKRSFIEMDGTCGYSSQSINGLISKNSWPMYPK
ncbi:hypothetical protein YC2023_101843 [Brassica napus]